jgi:hypothetical protein
MDLLQLAEEVNIMDLLQRFFPFMVFPVTCFFV